jgi:oligopeptide/dipeptide ABC transporter ATP-binding protein
MSTASQPHVTPQRDRGGPAKPLLTVTNLRKHFPVRGGLFNRTAGHIQAVDNVSFSVMKGETLGIVGESGCGKSTLARLILHLVQPDAGELIFDGEAVQARDGMSLRELRRNVQMVFQDSYSSLNPRMPVENSIAYGPRVHGAKPAAARALAHDFLWAVGLDPELFGPRYPHELSGGQKQRVNIARALALGPRLVILDTVGRQIAETVVRHDGCSYHAAYKRALDLLELVKVPSAARRLTAYPHELSGGLRQRAMIAMAPSCRPNLLLADEPTTALDATVQIQVLILLRQLQEELGMGVIFVTHDLGVAAEIADTIAVMYAGRMVETGSVQAVLQCPLHPYTAGMLSSTIVGHKRGTRIEAIPGTPPDLRRLPPGCSFAPRCAYAITTCTETFPPARHFAAGRMACCVRLHQDGSRR